MRIEQLFEGGSHLVDLAKRDKDPSALIVAQWLHKHGDVANGTSVEPSDISAALNLMNSSSYAKITAAFFFKGSLGYAGLYWQHHNYRNPVIVVSRDGTPITNVDKTGPDLRRFLVNSIGKLVAVYQLESGIVDRSVPKSVRHMSPFDARFAQRKLQKVDPGQLLPGDRSVAERMWKVTPWLFTALKRYANELVENDSYRISGPKDQVFDFFNGIIEMNGNIGELYESHLLIWYYEYRTDQAGGDDPHTIDEDIFLYDWDEIVVDAMRKANLTTSRAASARPGNTQPAPDYIKELSPFLLTVAKQWVQDVFFSKVWKPIPPKDKP